MSSEHSVAETLFGALQGTVSVLLTCFAGYVAARHGLLNRSTVKQISRLCTSLFLPCLLIVQMGPELTVSSLSRYWIIPLWGLISTIVGHLVGWAGQWLFNFKHWTIIACGRPNSNALPLLLLQSLETTGVLSQLSRGDDGLKETLSRAQSLLLLNAIVQQVVTFQLAPSVLRLDDGHKQDGGPGTLHPGPGRTLPITQNPERVGLLDDQEGEEERDEIDGRGALGPIEDVPDYHWPKRVKFAQKPLRAVVEFMSPPLIGAIIALIFGLVTPLHKAFLNQDGALYPAITQTVKNLGNIFVVLQTFIVGAELALVHSTKPRVLQTIWVLFVRFLAMPALGVLFVYLTAGKGWYVNDPLVWFLLILIPAGPSAMLLVSVAELVDIDQGPIAGYLTISYLLSPLMAIVCSIGLAVVNAKG
ncbi:membrane transport protein-domain-containing protein [Fomitopsis serialis]|uniref:membrane transport protein-domain-containing protein n=1 Tax=Fomitopsis serialis TaxID=139415 RepID=UPI0020077304|nr:membrane transport protein-domain-containing protein [Neoantrodia serialis]KAH9935621.1 membrane transport protein-domain-containing protein [Neoantrodia serialis]